MNINSGKTGTVNIPGALHSTGGDGDGLVGNVVAYAGDIYDENIGKNQKEINQMLAESGLRINNQHSLEIPNDDIEFMFNGDNGVYQVILNDSDEDTEMAHKAIERLMVGAEVISAYGDHAGYVEEINYDEEEGVLTFTLDNNIGEVNWEYYYVIPKLSHRTFGFGTFYSNGDKSTLLGQTQFNCGDESIMLGNRNVNQGFGSNIIGRGNVIDNSAFLGTMIGRNNIAKAPGNGYIIGEGHDIDGDDDGYSEIYSIGYGINTSGNTTLLNLGFENSVPASTIIDDDNYTVGFFGHHLSLTKPGYAIGSGNYEYDSTSGNVMNYFTLSHTGRDNYVEVKHNGDMYIQGIGGFHGNNSDSDSVYPLQDVLNQIASASTSGVTSWNDLEDKPTILDSYDVRQIVLEKSPLHYDNNDNYVTFIPNGSNDAYTPNTVSGTSKSVLIGRLNSFKNTYNGVVLGNNNTTDGNKYDDRDDSTVIVGKSNTNASRNSVLIGDSNNNDQNKSVLLGSSNVNKSECGINVGYYNQNNGGERNVMIGYDNNALNSASTLCMGSENRFTMSYNSPANQEIIAIGRGLYCKTGGIFLGYYNVDDYILTGDTANFLTIGDGSGNIYSSTRSNIIEQRRNGDIFIKGIGNYNGNNSRRDPRDPTRGKSLQEVLNQLSTDIQTVSANTGGGSGSSSGGSVSVTSDEDWVNEVLPGAILVSGVTITAKWITDTKRGNYVYLGFEADREVNWDLFNIDVYDWNTEQHYNRNKNDYTRIVDGCLMTELNQLSTLSGNTEAISTQEIAIEGNPSFGYSYTIECGENLINQMYDHDGNWWIDNLGNNISY